MSVKEAVKEAKRRIYDSIAMSIPVGGGLRCINPMATLYKESMRYAMVDEVRKAVAIVRDDLSPDLVPEVGMNIAYALPFPQGYGEVCGVQGRLVRTGERIGMAGEVRFGGSRHIARVVMSAMNVDPEMRCAMNLRFSDDVVSKLASSGSEVGSFDRAEEPDLVSSMEWGTTEAIRKMGHVPDVIFDRGGVGKEPMVRILGHDPRDVLSKISVLME